MLQSKYLNRIQILATGLLMVMLGCNRNNPSRHSQDSTKQPLQAGIQAAPFPKPSSNSETLFMALSPADTGIDFTNQIVADHKMKYLYASSMACGGVAIGDFDNDGMPDIYLTNGPKQNRLFRQTSPLKFEDVTEKAKVDGAGRWSGGAAMADVDNDGDLDIYVSNYNSANLLYINQGDGTFVEKGREFGVDFVDAGHTPTFCDYDRDGDLDFYLMTNFYYDPRGKVSQPIVGLIDGKPSIMPSFEKYYGITKVERSPTGTLLASHDAVGQPDRLVRNNGDNTFTDVSKESGIGGVGKGNSATWWDYNEDGWPDLYVANDFQDADRLYRNNGDGTFTNTIEQMVPHTTWFSMGADFADIDGDGGSDLIVADMSGTNHFKQKTAMGAMSDSAEFLTTAVPRQYMRNVVYVNSRSDRFMEAAHLTGLANSDWTWTVRLADFDNDGKSDVFFSNGMARNLNISDNPQTSVLLPGETEWDKHVRANTPPLKEQNLAFKNLGDLKFKDVSKRWGLDHVGMSYSAATADLDRDGDLDLVIANLEEPVSIYRNDSDGNRILIRLHGQVSNRWGIGAKLTIQTDQGQQVQELTPVRGYMASHEPLIHFGLGDEETISQLKVTWPSGHVQTFKDLKANQFYMVTEPSDPPKSDSDNSKPPTQFQRDDLLAAAKHTEIPYDDYVRQPLLPNQYSQLGPGLAWADIDGDQDDDLWIGGARGQSGQVFRNDGDGKFAPLPFVDGDEQSEDMAGIWFDADSDGDNDLYVVSGGVECDPGGEVLRDRLYLNNGKGQFSKAEEDALPDVRDSGGPVAAADFDRDGDLDLFVGGRIVPGRYPLAAESRLLQNDDGKFTDVTATLADSLQRSGMVTAAVWSDVDKDGWIDLLVTHEWGPVKLFKNQQGKLIDQTSEAGLSNLLGWWNGISSGDIDNDGDIDFAVTNFGLNTKYHASEAKPTLIYYGDFENNGRYRIVEAEFEDETLFPVRGKSCSTHAMPSLSTKFTTYTDFALADLARIYTPECLKDAYRFAANTLESGVLLNDGTGKFKFRALPRLAQIAPAFGVKLFDANLDGKLDLYLAQNFYQPQPETGFMAGGVSLLLNGHGDGTFSAVAPSASGLIEPGDARSLTLSDINGDGLNDLTLGINDGSVTTFVANHDRTLAVQIRLAGKPGNLSAIGSLVTLYFSGGSQQAVELTAGDGYLSQSSNVIRSASVDKEIEKIEVRWPNGTQSILDRPDTARPISISPPAG